MHDSTYMETTQTIREHATHISLNIEYYNFKYEQNGAHHKTFPDNVQG